MICGRRSKLVPDQTRSFSRDTARLYWLYMVAGAAAIPAGISYGYLATHGMERWWTGLLVIGFGLASAAVAWRIAEQRLPAVVSARTIQPEFIVMEVTEHGLNWRLRGATVAASALLFRFPSSELVPTVVHDGNFGQGVAIGHESILVVR